MDLIGSINDNNTKGLILPEKFKGWKVRIAVRAVLLDEEDRVAVMHIGKYNIYKLPGGGVDQEEDLATAFIREMKEETGCTAKATGDLGVFIEHREEWGMAQISFCYSAKVVEHGELDLTEDEIEEGFSLQWHKLGKAIELISNAKSDRYDDKYIRMRDTQILKAAQVLLKD